MGQSVVYKDRTRQGENLSENFKSLQIQEEGTENRISEARRKYNEAVQSYNVKVRRMPNAIIAGLFGFDHNIRVGHVAIDVEQRT